MFEVMALHYNSPSLVETPVGVCFRSNDRSVGADMRLTMEQAEILQLQLNIAITAAKEHAQLAADMAEARARRMGVQREAA